jgi:hypothetical protein
MINDIMMKEEEEGHYQAVLLKEEGGEGDMQKTLTTSYSENLPSPNYKTRHFSRTIQETIEVSDDEAGKQKFLEVAERHAKICETLVKNDIARKRQELVDEDKG